MPPTDAWYEHEAKLQHGVNSYLTRCTNRIPDISFQDTDRSCDSDEEEDEKDHTIVAPQRLTLKENSNHSTHLTFVEIAYFVLQRSRFPLDAEKIVRLGQARGMLRSHGATPAATLAAQLNCGIRDRPGFAFAKVHGRFYLRSRETEMMENILITPEYQRLGMTIFLRKYKCMSPGTEHRVLMWGPSTLGSSVGLGLFVRPGRMLPAGCVLCEYTGRSEVITVQKRGRSGSGSDPRSKRKSLGQDSQPPTIRDTSEPPAPSQRTHLFRPPYLSQTQVDEKENLQGLSHNTKNSSSARQDNSCSRLGSGEPGLLTQEIGSRTVSLGGMKGASYPTRPDTDTCVKIEEGSKVPEEEDDDLLRPYAITAGGSHPGKRVVINGLTEDGSIQTLAALANDAGPVYSNAKYMEFCDTHPGRVFLVSTKSIGPVEEIFVTYGCAYWGIDAYPNLPAEASLQDWAILGAKAPPVAPGQPLRSLNRQPCDVCGRSIEERLMFLHQRTECREVDDICTRLCSVLNSLPHNEFTSITKARNSGTMTARSRASCLVDSDDELTIEYAHSVSATHATPGSTLVPSKKRRTGKMEGAVPNASTCSSRTSSGDSVQDTEPHQTSDQRDVPILAWSGDRGLPTMLSEDEEGDDEDEDEDGDGDGDEDEDDGKVKEEFVGSELWSSQKRRVRCVGGAVYDSEQATPYEVLQLEIRWILDELLWNDAVAGSTLWTHIERPNDTDRIQGVGLGDLWLLPEQYPTLTRFWIDVQFIIRWHPRISVRESAALIEYVQRHIERVTQNLLQMGGHDFV